MAGIVPDKDPGDAKPGNEIRWSAGKSVPI
jgi:hypothetical protein